MGGTFKLLVNLQRCLYIHICDRLPPLNHLEVIALMRYQHLAAVLLRLFQHILHTPVHAIMRQAAGGEWESLSIPGSVSHHKRT